MTNEQLVSALAEYGADVDAIAERFLNDYDLYAVCLDKFIAGKSFEALGRAISKKEYTTAFEIAHDLKGVSGNLGLNPMYAAICGIVEPLRAREYGELNLRYAAIMFCLSELTALARG